VGNPVTLNNGTATSAGYLVGAVGYYCFRADYVPAQTANYSPGSHTNTSLTNPLAECFQAFNATAVRIDSFKGAAISTGARLRWHTTTEVDVMGFNVWRSTSKIGVYKKLNVSLIGARNVGMPTGLGYTFVDKSAKIGKTYFYKLEIVGPVSTLEWTDSLRVKMQLSQ
jgi:hypothetical protein